VKFAGQTAVRRLCETPEPRVSERLAYVFADEGSGVGNEYSPQRSYTGREPDPATGLIYYRARWFDPKLGRFISDDPIGFAAGDANLSRYVGNSTPNAVDPSGLAYFTVSSEEDQARALDGWLAWARSQGIGNFRFETLPEYVDPQGRRYERIRVWGTTSFYSALRFNVRFDGPTSYHRIGGGANSDLDSAICRNRYGDVMVMPRQTREALSNATGSLLEQGEKVRIVTYAVVVIAVPGPDDVVISGVLATSVARRLAAAGYEVISDGMRLIIKQGGEELSDEAAGAARKLIQETAVVKLLLTG
jgi:RHS repeat-associated protein